MDVHRHHSFDQISPLLISIDNPFSDLTHLSQDMGLCRQENSMQLWLLAHANASKHFTSLTLIKSYQYESQIMEI